MAEQVCVIIPSFNRVKSLRQVLECLSAQITEVSLKIVVIVDGSADGTVAMIKSEFSDTIIIEGDGSWWYTKCINQGLKKAIELKTDYVLTLNDDVIFGISYVESFMRAANSVQGPFIFGSASYTQSTPPRITFSGIRKIVKWRLKEISYVEKFSVVDPGQQKGLLPSVNLSGRGLFFKTELLNTLNLFDENFPQYGSDTDFTYRATKAGIPVYVSFDAKIFENEKLTSKGAMYNRPAFSEYFNSFFNKYSVNSIHKTIRYYRKHGSAILLPFYILFISAASLYVFLFKYRKGT